jgi:hypothetical protein
MSQKWNVIGFSAMSCVSTVTDCFVLFSRRSGRRWSICLRSGISGTWLLLWSLCSGVLSLYLHVDFALLSPARQGDAFIRLSSWEWAETMSTTAHYCWKFSLASSRLSFVFKDLSLLAYCERHHDRNLCSRVFARRLAYCSMGKFLFSMFPIGIALLLRLPSVLTSPLFARTYVFAFVS